MATDPKYLQRAKFYEQIEKRRGRPLIVYATSTRPNVEGMMAGDAVREFVEQIQAIGKAEAVDVLIHSYGGDPLAAWRIMSTLRETYSKVGVLVPFAAFSAATVLSLGADEIVMHPFAALGPIDPQIRAQTARGEVRFAYEDVGAFLKFIKEQVGVTEQSFLTPIMDKLFAVAEPLTIGAAQRASDLSSEMGERMLRMHMTKGKDAARCKDIAQNLNKSFFSHGDAVSRERARTLGLPIAKPDEDLERLIWGAFCGLEDYMELQSTFHPLTAFMKDPQAAGTLTPVPPLALPADTPPAVLQQTWNHVVQQALQPGKPSPEVPYEIVKVVVESLRRSAAIVVKGRVTAARLGQEIKVGVLDVGGGWEVLHEARQAGNGLQSPRPGTEEVRSGGRSRRARSSKPAEPM
ncbi:MAG: hypothetical protein NTY35_16755 [Planctomycetota bacterium]|nr:hypothetical protein [Planctomycetota bacterium]